MAYYCYRISAPPLSEYVDSVWVFEDFSQLHARESVLPTGTVDLAISLDDGGRDFSAVAGVRSGAVVIPAANRLNLVAVHFRPGGGSAFFKLPAGELQDSMVRLDVLWGSGCRFLREQLLEAGTARRKCRIVERHLLGRLSDGRVSHPAVRYALRELQVNDRITPTHVRIPDSS